MSHDLTLQETMKEWHGTVRAYLIGLTASLLLTGIAFLLVLNQWLPEDLIFYALTALALVQAVVQLLFFLHVGQEAKPRWETLVFYFMLLVLLIIGFGSLWIMQDLNKRVMAGMNMERMHD